MAMPGCRYEPSSTAAIILTGADEEAEEAAAEVGSLAAAAGLLRIWHMANALDRGGTLGSELSNCERTCMHASTQ